MGSGEKRLLCDPGSEVRLKRKKEKKVEYNKRDGKINTNKQMILLCAVISGTNYSNSNSSTN